MELIHIQQSSCLTHAMWSSIIILSLILNDATC